MKKKEKKGDVTNGKGSVFWDGTGDRNFLGMVSSRDNIQRVMTQLG